MLTWEFPKLCCRPQDVPKKDLLSVFITQKRSSLRKSDFMSEKSVRCKKWQGYKKWGWQNVFKKKKKRISIWIFKKINEWIKRVKKPQIYPHFLDSFVCQWNFQPPQKQPSVRCTVYRSVNKLIRSLQIAFLATHSSFRK